MPHWRFGCSKSVDRQNGSFAGSRKTWEEVRQLEVVRSEAGTPSAKTMADREKEMINLLVKVVVIRPG